MATNDKPLHMKALQAMLNAPAPFNTAEEARAYLGADRAYNEGRFQECLDLLATIKR